MRLVPRIVAAAVAFGLLAAACTGATEAPPRERADPTPTTGDGLSFSIRVPEGPAGTETSTAAMRRLCRRPSLEDLPPSRTQDPSAVPAGVLRIQLAVEDARQRSFLDPVQAEPLSRKELNAKLLSLFDLSFPDDLYARRSAAWQTIGAIPEDISIRDALEEFGTSQVVGFYVPSTKELYFIGTADPGFVSGVTLAHELTHALDDQHFDLGRLDDLEAACSDERYQAALGVVEGSAQFFAYRVALTAFTPEEALKALEELPGAALTGSPDLTPFIRDLELWPYFAGRAFVERRNAQGGIASIDEALRRFPVSTEQVIHPDRYPGDRPRKVEVPDAGPALGGGWDDIDVMDVGEAWLETLLEVQLDPGSVEGAAAGWDGGRYRAWSDGTDAAVTLGTIWDSPGDADEFAAALRRLADEVGRPTEVRVEGERVWAFFATDPDLLPVLESSI